MQAGALILESTNVWSALREEATSIFHMHYLLSTNGSKLVEPSTDTSELHRHVECQKRSQIHTHRGMGTKLQMSDRILPGMHLRPSKPWNLRSKHGPEVDWHEHVTHTLQTLQIVQEDSLSTPRSSRQGDRDRNHGVHSPQGNTP